MLISTAGCGRSSNQSAEGADAASSDASPSDTGSDADSTVGIPDAPPDSVGLEDGGAGLSDAPLADVVADSPTDTSFDQTADAADGAPVDASATDGAGEAGDGCVSGSPCAPANRCHAGTYRCAAHACVDTGNALADGTSCAGGWTCASGGCSAPATPQSCAPGGPGMTNCGSGSESCCTSLEVDGGTFYRTYTNGGDGGTGEADPATVSDLRVDKHLVTVGRLPRRRLREPCVLVRGPRQLLAGATPGVRGVPLREGSLAPGFRRSFHILMVG